MRSKLTRMKWNKYYDFLSQDMDKRKSCTRKNAYVSYEFAERVCKSFHKELRIYKCPYCSLYHITKKPLEDQL